VELQPEHDDAAQLPQALEPVEAMNLSPTEKATRASFRSQGFAPQEGHSTSSRALRTSSSNSASQREQMKSNMGIRAPEILSNHARSVEHRRAPSSTVEHRRAPSSSGPWIHWTPTTRGRFGRRFTTHYDT